MAIYRVIRHLHSDQFVFNRYISCCDVRIKINRDYMTICLPRDLVIGFINDGIVGVLRTTIELENVFNLKVRNRVVA